MKYLPFIIGFAVLLIVYVVFDLIVSYRKKSSKIKESQKGKFYTSQNYEVLYEDTSDRGTLSVWLNEDTMLWGRPDLVLRNKDSGEVIVVDYKSGSKKPVIPVQFRVQLASYFMLVENELNVKPQKGIIKYLEDNSEDSVPNDAVFNNEVINSALELAESKRQIDTDEEFTARRNHSDAVKCLSCEYKKICPEKL